jgi:tRNA (cytidine/uridine-2'-O-)-methyltransferase
MRIALYEPDQAGNVGTILRLAACLQTPVDIIEPCGFAWGERALKRAGMDYIELAQVTRHTDWASFRKTVPARIVLLTSRGGTRLDQARLESGDTLLFGSESKGVPPHVREEANVTVRIAQAAGTRSLNLAVAAGIALAEGLRQTGSWPE